MKEKTIRILDTVIQTSIVGFAASLPVSIAFYHICLGVGGAAFLTKCVVSGKWLGHRTGLDIYFGLFFASCLISSVTSLKPLESFIGLKEFFLMMAVYLVAYNTGSFLRIKEIAAAYLLTSALSGFYGAMLLAAEPQGRLLGAQGMAMTSGSIYMMSSLLSFWYLQEALKRGGSQRWLAGAASLVITTSMVLTKTISAWLGWAIGVAANPPFKSKRLAFTALAVMIAVVGAIIANSASLGLNYTKQQTWQARLTMWKIGWQIIKEHPVTGVGLIDLGEIYQSKRTSQDVAEFGNHRRYGHLHNIFIHVTAITGFLGLAAFGMMFWAMIRLFRKNLRSGPPERAGFFGAVLAVTAAFLIGGLAEWSFGDSEVVSTLWMVTGLAVAASSLSAEPVKKSFNT
ncbi:O-antigen ligase family protein [candidate division TA06 bacterium]|nr:O-antigen ligase family protein [candidate division TA06 bacterium]